MSVDNDLFNRAALFIILELERFKHDAPLAQQTILNNNEDEILEFATPNNILGECIVRDFMHRRHTSVGI